MSDRLWLGKGRRSWADVNLADSDSLESAIRAFAKLPGPLTVIGPPLALDACRAAWSALYEDFEEESVLVSPDDVTWKVDTSE
jgi:hypothetical protein